MLSELSLIACMSQGHIYEGVRMKAAALEQAHAQCPILLESQVFSSNEESGTAFNVGFSMYNYVGFRQPHTASVSLLLTAQEHLGFCVRH